MGALACVDAEIIPLRRKPLDWQHLVNHREMLKTGLN